MPVPSLPSTCCSATTLTVFVLSTPLPLLLPPPLPPLIPRFPAPLRTQALLLLPFSDALRLLSYLPSWLADGSGTQVELVARVSSLLVRLHHAQLVATAGARPALLAVQRSLRPAVQRLKDTMGFNVAALQHLQRLSRQRRGGGLDEEAVAVVLPAKRKLGKA